MNILIYIGIINVLLGFKLFWDYRAKNKQRRIINHSRSSIIDGTLYTVSLYALFCMSECSPLFIIGGVILSAVYRWILFDIFFNLLNKDKWNHYGQSSKLDLFLAKTGKYHMLVKSSPAILGIILLLL